MVPSTMTYSTRRAAKQNPSRVRPLGKVPVQVLWHPVRPEITGTQTKRYVNPQANLDALNGVEKEEPEPLIEHVEIEDLSEIRPRPEALQHLIARPAGCNQRRSPRGGPGLTWRAGISNLTIR